MLAFDISDVHPDAVPVSSRQGWTLVYLSVVAGDPHVIKVASLHSAMTACGLKHDLLDLGARHTQWGRKTWQILNLPRPLLVKQTSIYGENRRANHCEQAEHGLYLLLESVPHSNLVVFGDLVGSVAAARVGARLGMTVVHVEAGRRSWDNDDGEELNRRELTHLASMHFAVSDISVSNLTNSRIPPTQICNAGNLAAEVLVEVAAGARRRLAKPPTIVAAFHRAETIRNRARMLQIDRALELLSREAHVLVLSYPGVKLPASVVADREITISRRLTPPEYARTLLMANGVLTDSSGLQDDCLTLGIPCVTMRTTTHCVESVQAGVNVLVGFDGQAAFDVIMTRVLDESLHSRHQNWGSDVGDTIARRLAAVRTHKQSASSTDLED